ncbi:MAG TPA: hypothetical protein VGN20_06435 [Mucilaginibacter sp.]|jgi:hypothetical protein
MSVPPIINATVEIVSNNEMALFLECENINDAQIIDKMMVGYSIAWDIKSEKKARIFLTSHSLGSYSFDCIMMDTKKLNDVTAVCVVYRQKMGQLEPLPQKPLNRESPPTY